MNLLSSDPRSFLFFIALSLLVQTPRITAATIVANDSDLILGFRAAGGTGATLNLEVDLGSVSQFYNAPQDTAIDLSGSGGLAAADLISTYGSSWYSRSDLFFGLIAGTGRSAGTPDGHAPINTVWASSPETTSGAVAPAWRRFSSQTQGFASSDIESLYAGPPAALTGLASTANSSATAIVNYDGTVQTAGSWSSEELKASTASFNIYNPTIDATASQIGMASPSTLDGNSYAVLDLYEMQPNPVGGTYGALVGSFGLDSAGDLVFDRNSSVFAAAPEPTSLGLAGAGALVAATRRRRAANASR